MSFQGGGRPSGPESSLSSDLTAVSTQHPVGESSVHGGARLVHRLGHSFQLKQWPEHIRRHQTMISAVLIPPVRGWGEPHPSAALMTGR